MDKEYYLHIFDRYLSGMASPFEIDQLRPFMEKNHGLSEWMENQMMNSPDIITPDVQARILDKIRSQVNYAPTKVNLRKQDKRMRYYLMRFSGITAIMLVFISIFGLLYFKESPEKAFEVYANKGEKANLTLPEGSKVAINSDSRVVYYNDYNKNRHIRLQGEAYFEITPDSDNPFIVQCNDIKIKVLGTTFGVKAYDDEEDLSIVLNSGRIQLITPQEEIKMAPNDRIVYNRTRQVITIEKVKVEDYTGWKQNRLRFENESLHVIMKTISRMHNIDIVFENEHLKNLRFTGTIDNTNIERVLNAITLTSSVHYGVREGVIYLFEEK